MISRILCLLSQSLSLDVVYAVIYTLIAEANNELKRLFSENSKFSKGLISEIYSCNVQRHFNPAPSPHFKDIYEAAVKSTKFRIKRVVGEND